MFTFTTDARKRKSQDFENRSLFNIIEKKSHDRLIHHYTVSTPENKKKTFGQ